MISLYEPTQDKATEGRIQFTLNEDNFRVVLQSDAIIVDEVLQHFVQFLQSAGFDSVCIYDAMAGLAEEYEAAQKRDEIEE